MSESVSIQPQPGPQTRFLQSRADITVYGGAAGGGKSIGVILYPLRYAVAEPTNDFHAVIFRRTYPRITQAGGLLDESRNFYPLVSGVYNEQKTLWTFRSPRHRATVRFAHLQREADAESWKGAQIPLIAFDELTEFTERQFWYLQSRNRSTCGVQPQTIATTNPDADSWVKKFLAPWVDDTWPEEDRAVSGETRHLWRDGNTVVWLPRGERHYDEDGQPDDISVKFIFASIYDNPILLAKDPGYIKRLKALPLIDRLRLLNGDWNIRPEGGKLFRRAWFKVIDVAPPIDQWSHLIVRAWDMAASKEPTGEKKRGDGPDFTATVKIVKLKDGRYCVLDARKFREKPQGVEQALTTLAEQDGTRCQVALEQEPGSAGVTVVEYYVRLLAGYSVHVTKTTGAKIERARPASAQVEHGNVSIVRGPQTDDFLNDLEAFPNPHVHDDFPDAFDLAMSRLYAPDAHDHLQDLKDRLALREKRRKELEDATIV